MIQAIVEVLNSVTTINQRILTSDGGFYPVSLPDGTTANFPSVTTILKSVSNTELFHWWGKLGIAEATRRFEEAGEVGTIVHKCISEILSGGIIDEHRWHGYPVQVRSSVKAYIRWAEEHQFMGINWEEPVYSLKYGYAGTVDVIGIRRYDNHWSPCMCDWKTSSKLLPEYNMQLAAYSMAFREMHPDAQLDNLICVRLDKETGVPEQRVMDECEVNEAFEAFLGCLNIWKYSRKFRGK